MILNNTCHIHRTLTLRTWSFFIIFLFVVSSIASVSAGDKNSDSSSLNDSLARKYLRISVRMISKDSIEKSHEYARLALRHARMAKNIKFETRALNQLGYVNVYWTDYESALNCFLEALRKSRESQILPEIVGSLHGLARTYLIMKEQHKALQVLNEALQIVEKENMIREKCVIFNEFGNVYAEGNQNEKAIESYLHAMDIATDLNDSLLIIYNLNNIGGCYNKLKNFDKAIEYLNKAMLYNKYLNDAQAKSASFGNLGDVYRQLKQYDKAVEYINLSLDISRRQGFRVFTKDNYEMLSKALEESGDYQKALEYHKRYAELKDSLFNEDKTKAIQRIESRHQQLESDRKIADLEKDAANKTLFLRLTVASTILALGFLLLIFISLRLRIRLHKKEKLVFDETINQKNRELISLMMKSGQKRQMLEEIEIMVDKLTSSSAKELRLFIDDLKAKIRNSYTFDNDWQVLKTHFEEVHPDFFKTLSKKHPELSQNDLKLCAYFRINLSTKDIARLLNISDRSVQTARYRMKKKMNLDTDTDLMNYILSI